MVSARDTSEGRAGAGPGRAPAPAPAPVVRSTHVEITANLLDAGEAVLQHRVQRWKPGDCRGKFEIEAGGKVDAEAALENLRAADHVGKGRWIFIAEDVDDAVCLPNHCEARRRKGRDAGQVSRNWS